MITPRTMTAICRRCNHSETFPIETYWGREETEKRGWDYEHSLCPKCIEEIPAVYACWYYYHGRPDRLLYIFENEELAKKYCAHGEDRHYEKIRLYDYQHWEGER